MLLRFQRDAEVVPALDDSSLSAFGRRILDLSYACCTGFHSERRLIELSDELVGALERFVTRLRGHQVEPEAVEHRDEGVALFEEYLDLADTFDQIAHEQVIMTLGRLESRLLNHLLNAPTPLAA